MNGNPPVEGKQLETVNKINQGSNRSSLFLLKYKMGANISYKKEINCAFEEVKWVLNPTVDVSLAATRETTSPSDDND